MLLCKKKKTHPKQIYNEALYIKSERLSDTIRKRRFDFYGHIFRMNPARLTKQTFYFFHKKKTKPNWFNWFTKLGSIQLFLHFLVYNVLCIFFIFIPRHSLPYFFFPILIYLIFFTFVLTFKPH